MNVENILKTAEVLRSPAAQDHFALNSWFENLAGRRPAEAITECGTTACIAGWVQIIFDPDNDDDTGAREVGQGILDLTDEQATALFLPFEDRFYRASPDDAADVLEHLAKTGVVNWAEACPHLDTDDED